MKRKIYPILPLLAATLTVSSCRDYDLGISVDEIKYKKNLQEFANNFEEAIGGKISPDQNWNMAVQITANYDLTDLPEGNYNIRIFSENPINENAMLLANYDVNSTEPGSIKFDAIKGSTQVYVYILSENKQVVDSRSLKLTSNEVELLTSKEVQSRAATRASGTPEVGSAIDGGTKIYLNNDYIYPISNLDFGTVSGLTYGEVKGMFVGEDAVFKEEGANGLKYPDLIRDVTFTMKETGEFKMNLVWAITSNTDAFGYYYKDDADNYRIFRIFDNIQNEFKVGSTAPAAGGTGAFGSATDETFITSTIYKLAYVTDNGQVSYDFPAGTTIGFFIIPGGGSGNTYYQDYNVLYSQKKLNWKVSEAAGGAHNLQSTWSAYYRYNDKLYLGFEDWKAVRDNDYNDIVFYIDAPVEENEDASLDVTPETLTESLVTDKHAAIWSIAFEDLGNTLDFDFNDVVLQFKHVAGENNVDVILAAAGGTLPATLQRNSATLGKEVHEAFGVATNIPVNVNANGGKSKNAIENFASFDVDGGNFSITNLSDFSLHVVYSSGNGDEETAANLPFGEAYTSGTEATRAPQCLIIPGRWVWPNENKQVYEAYKGFKAWATGWTKDTSWSNVEETKIRDNWHKSNYETSLLSGDPSTYYTEDLVISDSSEKVEVESGLVTYHVELNRIGSAKYYGGTLNLKITDWKTDFSSEDGYNKIVLKGIQSNETFTLDIPTASNVTVFTSTSVEGLRYKVTSTGSDASRVVDIVIDLSSAAAIKLLGNYGDAESSNTNNNKFDVSAYASTCSAWIVSNSKPNDYTGELPEIDGDDQNMYPYDVIVPSGENITDCQQYVNAASASKIVLPNTLFEVDRKMKIHIEYGSTVTMSRMYGSNYIPDVPLTYGANSFTLTTSQVNAIYNNGAGLTLGFALNGVDQTKFVRAMWIEYLDADAVDPGDPEDPELEIVAPDGYTSDNMLRKISNTSFSMSNSQQPTNSNQILKFAVVISGGATGETFTINPANSKNYAITIEEGKTVYEFTTEGSVNNLMYNGTVSVNDLPVGVTVESMWVKDVTSSPSDDGGDIIDLTLGSQEDTDTFYGNAAKKKTATTTEDLSSWTEGATMKITFTGTGWAGLQVKDANGNIICGPVDSGQAPKDFDLTSAQLAQCLANGTYTFVVEYNNSNNEVATVKLQKK